jgi:4,5:9,10-diseco-3-hydroxy-5,9,17-trioxoandrosta-1(10),2-diene-4-oate hydrolase
VIQTPTEVPSGSFVKVASGHRIHYHEAGEGPVVLWVHGSGPGGSGWSNFQGNYEVLAAAGFRCIVPDLLGYGYSDKPPDAHYSLDFLTQGIVDFTTALGLEEFHLIGNSLGGALCIKLAIEQPQRVISMVLMAPGGLEERDVYMGMRGIRSMLRAIFAPGGINGDSMRRVFSKQLHDPSLLSDALIEQRLRIARTQPQAVFSTSSVPNQAAELGKITCPVLGLWGEGDQFCPISGADTLEAGIAQIRMIRFADCGHWVMVEYGEEFNRLVAAFLRESL